MYNSELIQETSVTLKNIFKQIAERRDVNRVITAGIVASDCQLARTRYLNYVDDNELAITL